MHHRGRGGRLSQPGRRNASREILEVGLGKAIPEDKDAELSHGASLSTTEKYLFPLDEFKKIESPMDFHVGGGQPSE